jgi:hypothetical protein
MTASTSRLQADFNVTFAPKKSQGNSISTETRLRTGCPGFHSRQGQRWDFLLTPRPDRLWNPSSLLCNGHWRAFPRGPGVKLTTLLISVPRLRMRGGMRVYPKISGLAAWSENCKWYSSLPLGAVVWLFCESV